jgi:hypothetical protein
MITSVLVLDRRKWQLLSDDGSYAYVVSASAPAPSRVATPTRIHVAWQPCKLTGVVVARKCWRASRFPLLTPGLDTLPDGITIKKEVDDHRRGAPC